MTSGTVDAPAPGASVVIVHDYLTQRGGAERVVLAMHDAFPDAPIHTSLFHPDGTYPEFSSLSIHVSGLNRIGALRRHHRAALPFLAPAFSSTEVAADVVVCSSSGWAHGVRTDGRKIVYCYAPAHWLYQADAYLAGKGRAARAAVNLIAPTLKRWDYRAAHTADAYITSSSHSQRMIREVYGLDAEVVSPPCPLHPNGELEAVTGLEPGFFLCVSRLTTYKHVDAVLEAFALLPGERLAVVGTGPEEARLHRIAPPNTVFIRRATDGELRYLYARARAVVAASFEDFGLTPLEGAMFGTPALVLRFGGYLDTVVDEVTGLFFDEPTPSAIADAVSRLDAADIDPQVIRKHAQAFSAEHFSQRMRAVAAGGRTVGSSYDCRT